MAKANDDIRDDIPTCESCLQHFSDLPLGRPSAEDSSICVSCAQVDDDLGALDPAEVRACLRDAHFETLAEELRLERRVAGEP